MKLFSGIRRRWHPLHRLRNNYAFRFVLRHFDPAVPIRLPGFSNRVYLRLLTHSSMMLAPEAMEANIRKVFKAVINHSPVGAAFWDVGANVGLFTFSCASLSPERPIVSFEPDSKNLVCLKASARRWKLPDHQILEAAVSDQNGFAEFYVDDISGATGSLGDPTASFNTRQYCVKPLATQVTVVTLDALMSQPNQSPPCCIKIDVEGAELQVLRGAEKVITQHSPILFIESFENREAIMTTLQDKDYEFYDTDHVSLVNAKTTNLLCLVRSRCQPDLLATLGGLGYPL